jgi:hypothetical protein
MDRYCGADDVYRVLIQGSGEDWLSALLAFALVEEQRMDWMRHSIDNTGVVPTAIDIRAWYQSQPTSTLLKAKAEAEAALKTYGAQSVDAFDDTYRKEVAQGIIVAEIQKLGRWLPQFGMNVAGGLVSSLVFSVILVTLALFVMKGPSTNDIAMKLRQQMEAQ